MFQNVVQSLLRYAEDGDTYVKIRLLIPAFNVIEIDFDAGISPNRVAQSFQGGFEAIVNKRLRHDIVRYPPHFCNSLIDERFDFPFTLLVSFYQLHAHAYGSEQLPYSIMEVEGDTPPFQFLSLQQRSCPAFCKTNFIFIELFQPVAHVDQRCTKGIVVAQLLIRGVELSRANGIGKRARPLESVDELVDGLSHLSNLITGIRDRTFSRDDSM